MRRRASDSSISRDGVKIRPILFGGGQRKGMRSGTENVPGCVGLGVAAREAYKDFDARIEKLYTLREHLIAGLKPLGGVTINGSEDRTNAPQIVSASLRASAARYFSMRWRTKGFMYRPVPPARPIIRASAVL
mgnify:CR=1 FL=1